MFTGIVTSVGTVIALERGVGFRARIQASYDFSRVSLGDSIACAGACLTVIGLQDSSFDVDISPETLARTTLSHWDVGHELNLELALRVGDRLGGHWVSGHVDGVGRVLGLEPHGSASTLRVSLPSDLARFVAEKGSITVDGVSLTVNSVTRDAFDVMLLDYTVSQTTFRRTHVGDAVNLEIDLLARYAARLSESR